MTEFHEPNFALDLPGTWERVESADPGVFAYHAAEGDRTLSVTLLAVRSMYTIADPKRLLDDYLHHRSKYEQGRDPGLQQSEPFSNEGSDGLEGGWDGVEPGSGRHVRHRVLIAGTLLADFRYEASGLELAEFDDSAAAILGSATATAG